MKKYLLIAILSLAISSCDGQPKNVAVIAPSEFAEKIKSDDNPQVIDVRTPAEFSDDHIAGAKNINWNGSDFEAQAAKLDKSQPVMVYCKSGGRSAAAAAKLSEMGFEKVYDLQGGFMKWSAAGLSAKKAVGGMSRTDFESLASGDKTLVSFYADWCAPCKKMKPFMDSLESQTPGLKVVKIDADANKALLSELGISDLPVLELRQNGKTIWQHKGFISEADLKSKLK